MITTSPKPFHVVIFVLVSCFFLSSSASKRCSTPDSAGSRGGGSGGRDGGPPLTCPSYCCGDDATTYCCSDCRLSKEKDDCDFPSFWRYAGYAIGSLALLGLLIGLAFGAVKLAQACCCKKRAASVGAAAAAAAARSDRPDYPGAGNYPRATASTSGDFTGADASQLPKKPPEYYEIFSINHPPPPPPQQPPPPPYTQAV